MKIRKRYRQCLEGALQMLYPARCPICHDILYNQKGVICPECFQMLHPILEPRCKKCGRQVSDSVELCRDCTENRRAFDEGRGIFAYTDVMQKAVLLYKYDGRREYGQFFSMAMSRYAKNEIKRWKPDLLIPIPLHKKKLRQRGYNQSAILARNMGKATGISVSERVLCKKKQTKSQKKLDARERRKNLKHAFSIEGDVSGLRILLVDDVFTTGSTMDAAAEILKEAGASAVFFLTLCIAGES